MSSTATTLAGVEGQGRQHVLAAAHSHHQHLRLAGEDVGQVAQVVAEQAAPGLPVHRRVEERAGSAVVGHFHDRRKLGLLSRGIEPPFRVARVLGRMGGDPRHGMPALVDLGPLGLLDRVDRIGLDPVDADQFPGFIEGHGGETGEDPGGGHRGAALPATAAQDQRRRQEGQRGDEDHGARSRDAGEQRHQEQAPETAAGEIGEGDPVHAPGNVGESEGQGEPAEEERQGEDEEFGDEKGVGAPRRSGLAGNVERHQGDAEINQERHDRAHRERRRGTADLPHRPLTAKESRRYAHRDAARGDAEKRQRDGDEGEVVPHRHREDPRQQDLEEQCRGTDQSDRRCG